MNGTAFNEAPTRARQLSRPKLRAGPRVSTDVQPVPAATRPPHRRAAGRRLHPAAAGLKRPPGPEEGRAGGRQAPGEVSRRPRGRQQPRPGTAACPPASHPVSGGGRTTLLPRPPAFPPGALTLWRRRPAARSCYGCPAPSSCSPWRPWPRVPPRPPRCRATRPAGGSGSSAAPRPSSPAASAPPA